jgi:hypothetical protein
LKFSLTRKRMTYYTIFVISVGQRTERMPINSFSYVVRTIGRLGSNTKSGMNTDIETYYCPRCNKEFLDKELSTDHQKSTGHKIRVRALDK